MCLYDIHVIIECNVWLFSNCTLRCYWCCNIAGLATI